VARAGLLLMLIPFSIIAAMMAFLITYEEMTRHYPGGRQPVRHAARTAVFTLAFFLALSWLIIVVLTRPR
jgi:hypothetical protein